MSKSELSDQPYTCSRRGAFFKIGAVFTGTGLVAMAFSVSEAQARGDGGRDKVKKKTRPSKARVDENSNQPRDNNTEKRKGLFGIFSN